MSGAAPGGELIDVLQPRGAGPALVMLHAMGGQTGCYQPLADCLADDLPVYGLRAPRPGEPLYPLRTVEAMAQAYVPALAAIPQPGPICLSGWSMGGLIAYEMARRLEAAGVEIAALVLVDTWLRHEQLRDDKPAAYRQVLDRRKWRVFMKLAAESVGVLEDEEHPFWAMADAERRAFILQVAARENPRRYGFADAAARLDADYDHYMVLRGAADSYRPGPWGGRMVWIAAEDERDQESPQVWATLAAGGCETMSCPGRHLQIVHPPYVTALAAAMRRATCGARAAA